MPETPRLTASRLAAAGYAALAVADTALAASSVPERRRLRSLTKPLLMPALGTAFAASLAARDLNRGGLLRGGTVAAQALSGVGDIALLGKGQPAFLAGLGSFLGAHVAYTAAFVSARRPSATASARRGAAAASVALAALAPAIGATAARRSPALRGPVIAYSVAISAMVASSTQLDREVPRTARRQVVAGTALFLVSDTTLAAREFLFERPAPWADATVMATYTLGQGLIAAGVSEAVRSRAIAGSATSPADEHDRQGALSSQ